MTLSTDTRGSRGWNTAGSGGTLTWAIAQIRLGDRGDHLGGSRFSLRGQRTGRFGTYVSRGRTPLRAGLRERAHAWHHIYVRGPTGRPQGLARSRQRLAGAVPADHDRRRGPDDRVRLLPRSGAAPPAVHADQGRGRGQRTRDRRALRARVPAARTAARGLA